MDEDTQHIDVGANDNEQTILSYLNHLEHKIEDHDPDQFFAPLFLAICFDVVDLPMELFDLIPLGGWILTGTMTFSEGFALWIALLGKGNFLRGRMRFWLWVWSFFEAFVPFGALVPARTIVILRFAAKNRKMHKKLVAERDETVQLLEYLRAQEAFMSEHIAQELQEAANDNTQLQDEIPVSFAPQSPRPPANDNRRIRNDLVA